MAISTGSKDKITKSVLFARRLRRLGALVVAILMALPFANTGASAEYSMLRDQFVDMQQKNDKNKIVIYALEPRTLEATITVDTVLSNMQATPACPCTVEMSRRANEPNHTQDIVQLVTIDPNQRYHFDYHFHAQKGLRSGKHDDSVVYTLPYAAGTNCKINQGYMGDFSHQRGSNDEYALDFGLPEGSNICAAREGTVISVRSDSDQGGNDKDKYQQAANYVIVKHSDGTYATYAHMLQNSPTVSIGQSVSRGQVLGQVGATGFVSRPHLHFDVAVPLDGFHRKTFPTRFRTSEGVTTLEQGRRYSAD